MNNRILDGRALARGMAFGTEALLAHQKDIDRINVFPIEDGDTGKNMAGTMLAVCRGLLPEPPAHAGNVLRKTAELAIAESRGCSGTILALFWEGFAESVRDLPEISSESLAAAARSGAAKARTGVAAPREGTILTVMSRWAEALEREHGSASDLDTLLASAHLAAQEALRKTTEQMDLLERRGVVDAGGLGFVRLLEGMRAHLGDPDRDIREVPRAVLSAAASPAQEVLPVSSPAGGGAYCAECVVALKSPVERAALEARVASLGDSLIVVLSGELAKIHVHTVSPAALFEIAASLGEVKKRKADDLSAQTAERRAMHDQVAIVTDSAADLPEEIMTRRNVRRVPITVRFGDQTFRDKEDLTAEGFLELLRSSKDHPTTAAPSVGDLLAAYERAGRAVAIHVTSASSATVQNARLAAERAAASGGELRVVDSKNSSLGMGLVVWKAAEAAAAGADLDEVARVAEDAVRRVKVLFYVDTLEYAVRGGRLPRPKAMFVTALGLKPLLGMSPEGKPQQAGVGFGERGTLKKLLRAAAAGIGSAEKGAPVLIGHVDARPRAESLAESIRGVCGAVEILLVAVNSGQAAHIGPGAVGVAWLGAETGAALP